MTEQIIAFGNNQHIEDLSKWVENKMKELCDKKDAERKAPITRSKLHEYLDEVLDRAVKLWLEENGQTETVELDSTDGWRRTEKVYLDGEEETAKEEIYPVFHDYIGEFKF